MKRTFHLFLWLLTPIIFSTLNTARAWEPTKPIEFVIPAGTGGGADQMARLIGGIADKHKLSPRPIIAVNKSGGAGAEGFLYVKEKKGDAHTMIITLSNLFTTPLHTGVPFNWKDLTPLARMALDQFILWVNADTPYKTAKEYIAAVKERSGGENRMKMGGTGSAQEDQIITIQLEQALGVKFTYVPFKGGGEVCHLPFSIRLGFQRETGKKFQPLKKRWAQTFTISCSAASLGHPTCQRTPLSGIPAFSKKFMTLPISRNIWKKERSSRSSLLAPSTSSGWRKTKNCTAS